MNKNRKIKHSLTTSLAVGMSVMMGAVPVYAAGSTDTQDVYKEETVYVNADATGNSDEVTVSDWLKNSGSVSGNLTDESILKEIINYLQKVRYHVLTILEINFWKMAFYGQFVRILFVFLPLIPLIEYEMSLDFQKDKNIRHLFQPINN